MLAYDLSYNMMCIPESEEDVKEKVSGKRLSVRPLIDESDGASDSDKDVAPSKVWFILYVYV